MSRIVFLMGALLLICTGSLFYPRWKNTGNEAQLAWDAGGYYWYLPSVFIYHDLKGQGFKDSILQRYQPTPPDDFQYGFRQPSGNYALRYTMGTALLEAPGFFIAHMLAKRLGYPADGFSAPYQLAVYLSGLLFTLLGLWYLRRLLLYYYPDKVVAIVLFLLVAGTNYLNYAGIDVGMAHCWLFTLYVFIFLNTHYYYCTFQKKYALRLGMLAGLAALIRPPEIISVLIPLLWGLEKLSCPDLKARLLLWRRQANVLVPAAGIGAGILFLQLLYWKYASGQWLVYTYREQGFSWLAPNIKQYALNYQCGWLVYTPMMIVAIAGIPIFFRQGRNRVAILALIFVNYYIVASWDAWDYGGRAMVQHYPALLFPLASLVHFLLQRRSIFILVAPVLLLFAYFNLWWTYQAHRGSIVGGVPATGAYFWKTVLRYDVPVELQKLRDNEDLYLEKVQHPNLLYTNNLDTSDGGHILVTGEQQASFVFAAVPGPYPWIRAAATIHIDQKEWNVWYMTHFVLRLKKGDTVVQENIVRLQRFLEAGETKNITIDLKVRHQDYDHMELLFRNDNKGSLPCVIDNLKVTGFSN